MWLLVPVAFPCEPVLEVQAWIPNEGPIRQGTWVRIQTDASYPSAELSRGDGSVFQLEERLADKDRPEGWLGWQIPDDLADDDWTMTIYDGADPLGDAVVEVRAGAQVGVLDESEELDWLTFDVAPTDEHPTLCDTGLEPAYHRVTAVVDVPAAPANGWLVEIREAGQEPADWVEMPRYGGTVTLSYLHHWTSRNTCPEVLLKDGFGAEYALVERGCVVLPDIVTDAADDTSREVCGCASATAGAPWGAALVALLFSRAAGRRGPRGADRRPPSGRPRR